MSNHNCDECGKSISDINVKNDISYCPFCGSLIETNHSTNGNRQWVPYYANIPLPTFATNDYTEEYTNYTIIELFDEKNAEIDHLSQCIESKIEKIENDVQSIKTSDIDLTEITSEDMTMENEYYKINEMTVDMTVDLFENDLTSVNYSDPTKFVSRIVEPWKISSKIKSSEYTYSLIKDDNLMEIMDGFDIVCNILNIRLSERVDKLHLIESTTSNYLHFVIDLLENIFEAIGEILDDLYTILENNSKGYKFHDISEHFNYQKEFAHHTLDTDSNDYLSYILIHNVLNYMNEVEIICSSYEFIDQNVTDILSEQPEYTSLYNINTMLENTIFDCDSITKVIPHYYDNPLKNIYRAIDHVGGELLDIKCDSIYGSKFELHNDIYVNGELF